VGNISWAATRADLQQKFAKFGQIESVRLITDRETGRSRGFAFINFTSSDAANAAVAEVNNTEFMGRPIQVGLGRQQTRAAPGSDTAKE